MSNKQFSVSDGFHLIFENTLDTTWNALQVLPSWNTERSVERLTKLVNLMSQSKLTQVSLNPPPNKMGVSYIKLSGIAKKAKIERL